jgi:hypothetical protein
MGELPIVAAIGKAKQSRAAVAGACPSFVMVEWGSVSAIDAGHLRTAYVEALNRAELR